MNRPSDDNREQGGGVTLLVNLERHNHSRRRSNHDASFRHGHEFTVYFTVLNGAFLRESLESSRVDSIRVESESSYYYFLYIMYCCFVVGEEKNDAHCPFGCYLVEISILF